MFCTFCGTKGGQGAAFCAVCGTKMQPDLQPTAMNMSALDSSPVTHPGFLAPSVAVPGTTYPPGYGPPPGSSLPPGSLVNAGINDVVDGVLGLALAPWWKRLVAIIIDSTVLGAAYFVVFAVIGAIIQVNQNGTTTSTTQNSSSDLIVAYIILFILASIPNALYFGIMNGSKRGQTLGKMALGIAVRDSRSGQKLGFWRGVSRFLLVVVFELFLYVPSIVDNLTPLWSKRRQAWHDMIVRSVVVDLKP